MKPQSADQLPIKSRTSSRTHPPAFNSISPCQPCLPVDQCWRVSTDKRERPGELDPWYRVLIGVSGCSHQGSGNFCQRSGDEVACTKLNRIGRRMDPCGTPMHLLFQEGCQHSGPPPHSTQNCIPRTIRYAPGCSTPGHHLGEVFLALSILFSPPSLHLSELINLFSNTAST